MIQLIFLVSLFSLIAPLYGMQQPPAKKNIFIKRSTLFTSQPTNQKTQKAAEKALKDIEKKRADRVAQARMAELAPHLTSCDDEILKEEIVKPKSRKKKSPTTTITTDYSSVTTTSSPSKTLSRTPRKKRDKENLPQLQQQKEILEDQQKKLIQDYRFIKQCLPAVLGWNDPYLTHSTFDKNGSLVISGAVFPATLYQNNQAQLWDNPTKKEARQLKEVQKLLKKEEIEQIETKYNGDYQRNAAELKFIQRKIRKIAKLEETKK